MSRLDEARARDVFSVLNGGQRHRGRLTYQSCGRQLGDRVKASGKS